MGNKKLPKNNENVSWSFQDSRVYSTIHYGCGCEYDIIWKDIVAGWVDNVVSIYLCEEHDPTIIHYSWTMDEIKGKIKK